jgi:hypothetical protein
LGDFKPLAFGFRELAAEIIVLIRFLPKNLSEPWCRGHAVTIARPVWYGNSIASRYFAGYSKVSDTNGGMS